MSETYNLPLNSDAIGLRDTINDDAGGFDLTEFEAQIQPKSDLSDASDLLAAAKAELGDEDSAMEDSDSGSPLFAFDETNPDGGASSPADEGSSADEMPMPLLDNTPIPVLPTAVSAAATSTALIKDTVKHIKDCQEIKEKIKALVDQKRITGTEYNIKRIESDPEYAANVNQSLHDIFERDNRCDTFKNFLVSFYRGIEGVCDGKTKILGKEMPNLTGLGDELELQTSTLQFKNKAGNFVDLVNDKMGSNVLDVIQSASILGMPFVRAYQNNKKRETGERVVSSAADINELEEETLW